MKLNFDFKTRRLPKSVIMSLIGLRPVHPAIALRGFRLLAIRSLRITVN